MCRVFKRISLGICFFLVGDHISVGICVFQSGKQILLKSSVLIGTETSKGEGMRSQINLFL